MKHPALTRLFAVALAILSLVMLIAGAAGISKAAKDRNGTLADVGRLRGRMDEYNTVTMALDGTISYEEANRLLTERQEQHDADAAQHRSDLAMYSATRGGVLSGEEALEQADSAMDTAWAQFRAGEAEFKKGEEAFNEGYRQFQEGKTQLEEGIAQYEALKAGLDALTAFPETIIDIEVFSKGDAEEPDEDEGGESPKLPDLSEWIRDHFDLSQLPDNWEDVPDWPEEWPDISDLPEDWLDISKLPSNWADIFEWVQDQAGSADWPENWPDISGLPSNWWDISGWLNGILSQRPAPTAQAGALAAGQGSSGPRLVLLSTSRPELPDNLEDLMDLIPPEFGSWELPDLSEIDPTAWAERKQAVEAYDSLLDAYDVLDELVSSLASLPDIPEDMLPEDMGEQIQMLTGTVTIAKQGLRLVRDRLEAGSGEVTGLELAMAQAVHQICKEAIIEISSQITEPMAPMVEELGGTLATAKAEMDALEPEMEKGKAAIEEGRQAMDQAYAMLTQGSAGLANGKAALRKTLNELSEKARELQRTKRALEKDTEELETMAEETRQQKELERRQTSLRVMLLDRDGIEQRVAGGMELLAGAEDYAVQLERDAAYDFLLRLIACFLMLLGGVAGVLGILAAFEKLKGRPWLISPVVTCLLCAVAAECVFEFMGRGRSYSAIFAGIFAIVQLIIIIPKPKKSSPQS